METSVWLEVSKPPWCTPPKLAENSKTMIPYKNSYFITVGEPIPVDRNSRQNVDERIKKYRWLNKHNSGSYVYGKKYSLITLVTQLITLNIYVLLLCDLFLFQIHQRRLHREKFAWKKPNSSANVLTFWWFKSKHSVLGRVELLPVITLIWSRDTPVCWAEVTINS